QCNRLTDLTWYPHGSPAFVVHLLQDCMAYHRSPLAQSERPLSLHKRRRLLRCNQRSHSTRHLFLLCCACGQNQYPFRPTFVFQGRYVRSHAPSRCLHPHDEKIRRDHLHCSDAHITSALIFPGVPENQQSYWWAVVPFLQGPVSFVST